LSATHPGIQREQGVPCPAIANERLKRNRGGDIVLQLKNAFKDGATHIVMSPLGFMQRLAALVPVRAYTLFASMTCWRT